MYTFYQAYFNKPNNYSHKNAYFHYGKYPQGQESDLIPEIQC